MRTLPKIKVCGLTREEDVDRVLSLGVDYCGFIVYPKSPRGLTLERAAELANRVPEGKRVVVDVETDSENLKRLNELGFDYYQIHAKQADRDSFAKWSELVGKDRLWLSPHSAPEERFPEACLDFAGTILVDTFSKDQVGGTGQVGDWERFAKLQAIHPHTRWILAGGLSPDNLAQAVEESAATCIDVNSGVESAPGIKDAQKLTDLFRALASD